MFRRKNVFMKSMGIFIRPQSPVYSYVLLKNKPYFNSSREMGGSFWRKETNDF